MKLMKYIFLVLMINSIVPWVEAANPSHAQQVIEQVKQTVIAKKWIADPACTDYLYTVNAEKGVDLVDIVEKHGGRCGHDVQVQHRLFSVYVDQKTHQMASDKKDPINGTLSLLTP